MVRMLETDRCLVTALSHFLYYLLVLLLIFIVMISIAVKNDEVLSSGLGYGGKYLIWG